MTENIILCRGQSYELRPESYWHLAHPTAGFLFQNVALNEGICWSISAINCMPGLENAMSLYSLKVINDKKEKVWDRIRMDIDTELPSRKGAIFLFDSEEMALAVMAKWFPTETRHLLEVRVTKGGKIRRADAKWLDCDEDRWEENAYQYWAGNMMCDPIPEVLVEGAVYFPGWKRQPFGVGTGISRLC